MDQKTPDLQAIRQLYAKSAVARAFLDHVAGRKNDQSETKIERILRLLRREGHNFSKTDIRGLFRNLEDLSCGTYIIGRRGYPSRFKWSVGITSLSRAATRGEYLQFLRAPFISALLSIGGLPPVS